MTKNSYSKKTLIHARNVTGLGATQVVHSLISVLDRMIDDAIYILPGNGALSDELFLKTLKGQNIKVRLRAGRLLSRMLECLFPKFFFPDSKGVIVLGDIPLRGLKNQIVLVHQPNLLAPSVSPNSSRSIKFKVMRCIFRYNLKSVRSVIVQSDVMKNDLISTYPSLIGRVISIPQPAPGWFHGIKLLHKKDYNEGLVLFYPAAGYPHKNHKLIENLLQNDSLSQNIDKVVTTLEDKEQFCDMLQLQKVDNIGQVSPNACLETYSKVDALFFPSLAESYGLPLVEAMKLGLPVICADLPYARWMCGDTAIYFDPFDVNSAADAIKQMNEQLSSGWRPSWSDALGKLPSSWKEVGEQFVGLLEK